MIYTNPFQLSIGQKYRLPEMINGTRIIGAVVMAQIKTWGIGTYPNCFATIRGLIGNDEVVSASCSILPYYRGERHEGIVGTQESSITYNVPTSGIFQVMQQVAQKNNEAALSSTLKVILISESELSRSISDELEKFLMAD